MVYGALGVGARLRGTLSLTPLIGLNVTPTFAIVFFLFNSCFGRLFMYRSIRISLVAAIAGILLVACSATGPRFDAHNADMVSSNDSHIYLFRNSAFMESGTYPIVMLDGKEVGELRNGGFLLMKTKPGPHLITVQSGGLSRGQWIYAPKGIGVDAAPGTRRYVQLSLVTVGISQNTTYRAVELSVVAEADALKKLTALRQSYSTPANPDRDAELRRINTDSEMAAAKSPSSGRQAESPTPGEDDCGKDASDADSEKYFLRGKALLASNRYRAAMECFLRAQENKEDSRIYRESCSAIGTMYELGWGVEKDIPAAMGWFKKAGKF